VPGNDDPQWGRRIHLPMNKPHELLIQVSARLFADGHQDLAYDVRQLALRWTPEREKRLIHGPEEDYGFDPDCDPQHPLHDT